MEKQNNQGEPVALPARKNAPPLSGDQYGYGWNACLDEIDKLGPLFTHADPGDVERLAILLRQTQVKHSQERDTLRAQLAERDALLRHMAYYLSSALEANAPHMSEEALHHALSVLDAYRKISASAEPKEERGSSHGFENSPNTCRHDERSGVWWIEGNVTRTGQECIACGHVKEDPETRCRVCARPLHKGGYCSFRDCGIPGIGTKGLSASAEPSAPTFADAIKNPPKWVGKHLATKVEPSAPKCKYCGDTGQIMVGRSGDANDGNAPIMEPCEDCDGPNAPVEIDERTAFDPLEWLETEITAVDTWYRGSPSYEHDAGWMKDQALRLVAEARAALERKPS